MMKDKVQDAFNKQINAEYFSSYLYLSMSAWLEGEGFKGMAHWMRMQASEELNHALKFFDFIHERAGTVKLTELEGPRTKWKSPLDVFEDALDHERKVTGMIDGLVGLARSESDYASDSFLIWFVNEQVEEEATAQEIVDKLKLAGDSGAVLFMLDQELSQRPAPAAPTTPA